MADKKDKKEEEKANALLEQHPDVQNSAGKYFTFDKNPVVRETWPQGDPQQPTLNPSEVTGKDLLDLGAYAIGILDPRVMGSNPDTAYEEAARRAVNDKDDGRYAGRLNSKMIDLVIQAMDQQKPKGAKPEDINTKVMDLAVQGQKEDGKGEDLPASQSMYVEPGLHKAAAKGVLDLKGMAQHARKDNTLQQITQEARKLSKPNVDRLKDVLKAVDKGTKGKAKSEPTGKKEATQLVEMLDKVAADLEALGHTKWAADIDLVSNTIESLQEG